MDAVTVAAAHPRSGEGRRPVQRRLKDWIAGGAGLAVILLCAVIARNGTTGPLEQRVFHWINGSPALLFTPMRVAQLLGILAVGPIVAVVAAVLQRWRLVLAAVIVTVAKLAAERIVWHFVQRERPGTTIADAIVRGSTPKSGVSFVSGHVVLVTGLAWAITPYLHGSWKLAPWAVVVLVAFARMYLCAHAPLDVLGGIGLGLVVGAIASLIAGVERYGPTR
jgi:membrane-associated phospholipid phosphatase